MHVNKLSQFYSKNYFTEESKSDLSRGVLGCQIVWCGLEVARILRNTCTKLHNNAS